jgi:hypothetical protein
MEKEKKGIKLDYLQDTLITICHFVGVGNANNISQKRKQKKSFGIMRTNFQT